METSNSEIRRAEEQAASTAKRIRRQPKVKTLEQQLEERVSKVPGIGPKYEQLLRAHGIVTISDLMRLHMQEKYEDTQRTQQFLQDTVKIRNSSCLRAIIDYVRDKQQELKVSSPSWLKPKVTLSVEGNISAGKSTFLKILEHKGLLNDKLQVVPEPVAKWQDVGKRNVNLLMEFYKNPERMAYTFQNYVFLTRMVQERESYTAAEMCRLLERSVFSDRMVFVRAVHAAKQMDDTELSIYDSWFDPVLSTLPTLVPNGFIYLKAEPETCHKRLQKRAREEESTVKLGYLQELHARHEDWLIEGGDPLRCGDAQDKYLWVSPSEQLLHKQSSPQQASPLLLSTGMSFAIRDRADALQDPVAAAAALRGMRPEEAALMPHGMVPLPRIPRELDGLIRFLDVTGRSHMHPLLHTIPALELDCNRDVDVERDEDYKDEVSRKVSLYTDYVRDYMLARGEAINAYNAAAAGAASSALSPHSLAAATASGMTAQSVLLGNSRGGSASGAQAFNGYSLDVHGTTLYVDPHAPLLAYTTETAAAVAARRRSKHEQAANADAAASGSASGTSAAQHSSSSKGNSRDNAHTTDSSHNGTLSTNSSWGEQHSNQHLPASARRREKVAVGV